MSRFPELPIITPGPERKSTAQKYGGLFYLAIAGLVVCFGLLMFFGLGLWSMRTVWSDIYLVNDVDRPEIERVNAAWRLARDPRVNDRQKWDLALSKIPPPLARYLLAESLSSDAPYPSPRSYAHAVARSKGLPEFLPILLARPLAYAAAAGRKVDRDSLLELSKIPESEVADWALLALVMNEPESPATEKFEQAAKSSEFARKLHAASQLPQPNLREALDEATRWLRTNQGDCQTIWKRWKETDSGIVRGS